MRNSVGNWETEVIVDENSIITRVDKKNDGEFAILLRDLAVLLEYEIKWNPEQSRVTLINKDNNLSFVIGDNEWIYDLFENTWIY